MYLRRRYRLLGAALLLAGLLVGAFAVLDFQVLESETATDFAVGTSQLGNATAPDGSLTLVVLEGGAVADQLGPDLEAALSDRFGPVTTTTAEPMPPWNGSVLVVAVSESSIQYNPIAPSGQVRADVAFVGSGNATFATSLVTGADPLVVTNAEPYVIHGTVTVTDRSRGLVSVPGYRAHLRDALVSEIARTIDSAPGMD